MYVSKKLQLVRICGLWAATARLDMVLPYRHPKADIFWRGVACVRQGIQDISSARISSG
jgi:hypothetical protein